jgi:small-conductance mechanosensitive channel
VIGIAVGFGAQKLVQDVITGMFVLLENAIQIGDWVTVAGLSGNIERLSVRNVWLRGNDGAVHIIPFSAVTSITNTNRGFGNAAVSVTVAYKEDSDRIAGVLSGIAAEMRADPTSRTDARRSVAVGRYGESLGRNPRRGDRLQRCRPLAGPARVQPPPAKALQGAWHRARNRSEDGCHREALRALIALIATPAARRKTFANPSSEITASFIS